MKKVIGFLLILFVSTQLVAQEKHLNIEDAVLGYYKGLYPKNLTQLQWIKGTDTYIYREADKYVIKDIANTTVGSIELSNIQKALPDIQRLPYFKEITKDRLVFQTPNSFEFFNFKNNTTTSFALDENAANQDFCLKNDVIAYTIANNLYVATASDAKIAVTNIDDKNIVSGQAIHRYEFGISKGTFWSPRGNYLAFSQKDETNVSDYPIVDVTTYPASLTSVKYPMAGQASEQAKIGYYNIATKELKYLDIDTSDEHYLTNLSWSPDERYILLAEVNRAQNHMWFNVYDVSTGKKVKTLFEEKNDKWVEPETPAEFLPNSNTSFLWFSERDGFMNIYQYDLFNSTVKQVTDFNFVVQKTLGFNAAGNTLFVEATGNDPKGKQTYKIDMQTYKAEQITKDGGSHSTQLSSSGKYLLDNYTDIKTPRKVGVIDIATEDCKIIFEAENPLKDYKLGTTEFVKLKAKNGMDLEARILKPANFDKNKKYPVMVYVYGGPHAQMINDVWLGGASLCMNYLAAEKDYIVFTLDNRGSQNKGFAFESEIHRKQGIAAMEDQMTGVEYLKSLSYVDADRMAIFGWSYGGFMTTSMLLRHPEVFTTGVAGGPVIDWKYYEIMYGERYMDTPQENPEGYAASALPQYIENLEGKLLLIHGSIDDVVVPQHSMALLDEAVAKGVQLDFFTYPMHKHNVRGKERVHLMTKVVNYILENNK